MFLEQRRETEFKAKLNVPRDWLWERKVLQTFFLTGKSWRWHPTPSPGGRMLSPPQDEALWKVLEMRQKQQTWAISCFAATLGEQFILYSSCVLSCVALLLTSASASEARRSSTLSYFFPFSGLFILWRWPLFTSTQSENCKKFNFNQSHNGRCVPFYSAGGWGIAAAPPEQ